METKYKIALGALLALSILGVGFVAAYPMGFRRFQDFTAEDFETFSEERQQMVDAIENGDYDTWKTLMEDRIEEMKSDLTEENFDSIVERHSQMKESRELRQQIREAIENGDYENAEQLKEQMLNSAPQGNCGMHGMGMGPM